MSSMLRARRCPGDYPALVRLSGPGAELALNLVKIVHRPSIDLFGGIETVRDVEPLSDRVTWNSDDTLASIDVDIALLPAVTELARRRGVAHDAAEIIRLDVHGLGAPDAAAVARLARSQPINHHVLNLVREHGRGPVVCAAGVRPEPLAAEVAAAWPTRRFLIVARNTKQAARAVDECRRVGVEPYRLRSGKRPADWTPHRVIVTTPVQLSLVPTFCVDVLLALDTSVAIGAEAGLDRYRHRAGVRRLIAADDDSGVAISELGKPCNRWRFVRRVVFGRLGDQLSPGEVSSLVRLTGFAETIVFPKGCAPVHVQVERVRIRKGPHVSQFTPEVDRFRRLVSRNALRNRLLASEARRKAVDGTVVVIGDSVEHVAALATELPEWPVRLAEYADLEGLPPRHRLALDGAADSAGTSHLIATVAAACQLDLSRFDSVIRCDTGSGVIDGMCAVDDSMCARSRKVCIVDPDDRFDPELRKRSRRRIAAYASCGWFRIGEDPVAARASLFVDQCLHAITMFGREG